MRPNTDVPLSFALRAVGMSDKDLLGIILGAVALMMFATGIILVI
ncbi:hypothetical protein [Haloprofundus salinisoli]|nr:hypothetical protein [Haloprofundus salinisoli]